MSKTSFGSWLRSSPLSMVLGWVYVAFLLPHCFCAFVMLKADKFMPVFRANFFFMQLYMILGVVAVKAFTAAVAATTKKEDRKKE